MLIDDLNALVGTNTIHAIPHVTSSTISGFVSPNNLAVQMDGAIGLYHYTGSWNLVNSTLNNLFISLSIGFEMPTGYNGVAYGGTIHKEWPASRQGSCVYVCASNSDLLLLDQALQGDLAVVEDRTYLLNLRPSYISINWLLLVSSNINVSKIVGLDKTSVGLGNVDNTSDASKPISNAETAELLLKQSLAEKNAYNGYAGLDANAKLLFNLLPDAILGGVIYMGAWDMSTPLPSPTIDIKGHYYIASGAGDGYSIGDWAVCDGAAWDKIDNNNLVQSVQGRRGDVVIDKNDIGLSNVDNTADIDKIISTATQLALDLKADKGDIASLTSAVTDIVNNIIVSKADKVDVDALTTQVNTILTDLGLKADQTSVDSLVLQMAQIQTDVTDLLTTQVNNILTDLGLKANQTDVDAIVTQIATIQQALATKADQFEFDALVKHVYDIQTGLDVKVDQPDFDALLIQSFVQSIAIADKVDKTSYNQYVSDTQNTISTMQSQISALQNP